MKTRRLANRNITTYYEYKDRPCIWEKKKYPKRQITQSKFQIVYDMYDFFNNAVEISEKEYNEMIQELQK